MDEAWVKMPIGEIGTDFLDSELVAKLEGHFGPDWAMRSFSDIEELALWPDVSDERRFEFRVWLEMMRIVRAHKERGDPSLTIGAVARSLHGEEPSDVELEVIRRIGDRLRKFSEPDPAA